MNRELKFREWIPSLKRFHYWGLIDGGFVGPSEPKGAHSQFTGMMDWYEGDILNDDFTDIVSIIRFGFSKKTRTIGFYLENIRHSFLHYPIDDEMEGYERIGNIYEHPTLLQP